MNQNQIDMALGEQAERLLADEGLKKVIERMEADAVQEWKNAPTVELREKAHARYESIARITQTMRSMVEAGRRARHYVEQERDRANPFRNRFDTKGA